jgi:hypothetical protein
MSDVLCAKGLGPAVRECSPGEGRRLKVSPSSSYLILGRRKANPDRAVPMTFLTPIGYLLALRPLRPLFIP